MKLDDFRNIAQSICGMSATEVLNIKCPQCNEGLYFVFSKSGKGCGTLSFGCQKCDTKLHQDGLSKEPVWAHDLPEAFKSDGFGKCIAIEWPLVIDAATHDRYRKHLSRIQRLVEFDSEKRK